MTGKPAFVAVDPATDEPVQRLVEQAAVGLIALLERRGVLDDSHRDSLRDEAPVLASGRLQWLDAKRVSFTL